MFKYYRINQKNIIPTETCAAKDKIMKPIKINIYIFTILFILTGSIKIFSERVVIDNQQGSIFTYPVNLRYEDLGAYLGLSSYINFHKMKPLALKITHGRFHSFCPVDDTGYSFFPYTLLKNFENDEIFQGFKPIWVTASYGGVSRPVYWKWSLGSIYEGQTPIKPQEFWSQTVNLSDDRYIRFWIQEYVRGIMWNKHYGYINLFAGLDNCAFNYALYCVLDDENRIRDIISWDIPFSQNKDQFYESIKYFMKKIKELAPDIRIIGNLGSIGDWNRFPEVWNDFDGLMAEEIYPENEWARYYQFYSVFNSYQWLAMQNKIAVLRAGIKKTDYQNNLRKAFCMYLLLWGENFFFNPKYYENSNEIPPENYAEMKNYLGYPVRKAQSKIGLEGIESKRIYSREYEGGLVFVNFSGFNEIIKLPENKKFITHSGDEVTTMILVNGDADYILYNQKRRSASPQINPRFSSPIIGAVDVVIDSDTSNSEIRWTIDGSDPTDTSSLYTAPIKIDKSATIKTKVFHPYLEQSFIRSASYIINKEIPIVQFHLENDLDSEFISQNYPLLALNDISSTEVIVKYYISGGSALHEKDYYLNEGKIIFKPFEKYKYFVEPIRIINDNEIEEDETIEITISEAVNAFIGAKNKFTYKIIDNEIKPLTPTPTFSQTPTPSITLSPTPNYTQTPIPTPDPTSIPSPTPTLIITPSYTPTPIPTPTLILTNTPTPVPTITVSPSFTPMPTNSITITPVITPTNTLTSITLRDLINHINGEKILTDPQFLESADFNRDGKIDIADVVSFLNIK